LNDQDRRILRRHVLNDLGLARVRDGEASLFDMLQRHFDAQEALFMIPEVPGRGMLQRGESERLGLEGNKRSALAVIIEHFEETFRRLPGLKKGEGGHRLLLFDGVGMALKQVGEGLWAEAVVLKAAESLGVGIGQQGQMIEALMIQLRDETLDAAAREEIKDKIQSQQKFFSLYSEVATLMEDVIFELLVGYSYQEASVRGVVLQVIDAGRLEQLTVHVDKMVRELTPDGASDHGVKESILVEYQKIVEGYLVSIQKELGRMTRVEHEHLSFRQTFFDAARDVLAHEADGPALKELVRLYAADGALAEIYKGEAWVTAGFSPEELGTPEGQAARRALVLDDLQRALAAISYHLICDADFHVRFDLGAAVVRPTLLYLDFVPTPAEFENFIQTFGPRLKAVLAGTGSPQSHFAIVAKALNIPVYFIDPVTFSCLNDCSDALVLDGVVVARPNKETVFDAQRSDRELEERDARDTRLAAGSDVLGAANADTSGAVAAAVRAGAEAIGLDRTEVLYKGFLPTSLGEQIRIFGEILKAAGSIEVTFRVIDPGLDKWPPAWTFLRYDGALWWLEHPFGRAIARQQLRAWLRLWQHKRLRNFRVMFPMIRSACDMQAAKLFVREAMEAEGIAPEERIFDVGAMIENAEAAEAAEEILQEADFFSFGTNDMTQSEYHEADRTKPASYIRFYSRAMPRVVRAMVIPALVARKAHKHASVCGDAAATKDGWSLRGILEAMGLPLTLSMPYPYINRSKAWHKVMEGMMGTQFVRDVRVVLEGIAQTKTKEASDTFEAPLHETLDRLNAEVERRLDAGEVAGSSPADDSAAKKKDPGSPRR